MKIPFLLLSFLLSFFAKAQAQAFLCDSLNGKDYAALYQEASYVCIGRITTIVKNNNGKEYGVRPLYSFKGMLQEFQFSQSGNPHFFHFKEDSSYVFFVFEEHADKVFTPCLFFGFTEKMDAFIEWASQKCEVVPVSERTPCSPNFDPVCGCNGVTYADPCEALNAGIQHAVRGRCIQK